MLGVVALSGLEFPTSEVRLFSLIEALSEMGVSVLGLLSAAMNFDDTLLSLNRDEVRCAGCEVAYGSELRKSWMLTGPVADRVTGSGKAVVDSERCVIIGADRGYEYGLSAVSGRLDELLRVELLRLVSMRGGVTRELGLLDSVDD